MKIVQEKTKWKIINKILGLKRGHNYRCTEIKSN